MSKDFSSDFMEYCRKRENAKEEAPVDDSTILERYGMVRYGKGLYNVGYFNAVARCCALTNSKIKDVLEQSTSRK